MLPNTIYRLAAYVHVEEKSGLRQAWAKASNVSSVWAATDDRRFLLVIQASMTYLSSVVYGYVMMTPATGQR